MGGARRRPPTRPPARSGRRSGASPSIPGSSRRRRRRRRQRRRSRRRRPRRRRRAESRRRLMRRRRRRRRRWRRRPRRRRGAGRGAPPKKKAPPPPPRNWQACGPYRVRATAEEMAARMPPTRRFAQPRRPRSANRRSGRRRRLGDAAGRSLRALADFVAPQDTGGGICEAVAGAADAGSARGRVAADAGAAAQGAAAAAARREARAPALVGPHGAGREAVVLRLRDFSRQRLSRRRGKTRGARRRDRAVSRRCQPPRPQRAVASHLPARAEPEVPPPAAGTCAGRRPAAHRPAAAAPSPAPAASARAADRPVINWRSSGESAARSSPPSATNGSSASCSRSPRRAPPHRAAQPSQPRSTQLACATRVARAFCAASRRAGR